MFKQLIFIALIVLAASKHHKSHKQGCDEPEEEEDPYMKCMDENCLAEMEQCFISETCLGDLFACDDYSEVTTGVYSQEEKDCANNVVDAVPMIQCLIDKCSEPYYKVRRSHKQTKMLKKLSKGLRQ